MVPYSKYSTFLKDLSALVAFLLLFILVKPQIFTAAALAMAVNNRMHYLRLQARNSATGASCPTDTYSVAENLAHGLQHLFDMSASLLRYILNCCGASADCWGCAAAASDTSRTGRNAVSLSTGLVNNYFATQTISN